MMYISFSDLFHTIGRSLVKESLTKTMSQIVYIEQLRIEREQKIRSYALSNFPWEEMELIQQYIIHPLSEDWSKQRQIIIAEAAFRLVFEAYILGLSEQKKGRTGKKRSNDFTYDSLDDQKICQLIQKIMEDFVIYRFFSYQTQESIRVIFHSLAQEWFLRGRMRTAYC